MTNYINIRNILLNVQVDIFQQRHCTMEKEYVSTLEKMIVSPLEQRNVTHSEIWTSICLLSGIRNLKRIFAGVLLSLGMFCFAVVLNSTSPLAGVHSKFAEIQMFFSQGRQRGNSSNTNDSLVQSSLQTVVRSYHLVFDSPPKLPYFLSLSNNHSGVPTNDENNQNHTVESRQRVISFYHKADWLRLEACSGAMSECPVTCTCSINPDDVIRADAVIFNGVNLPSIVPKRGSSNQTWVFFGFESPVHYSQMYKLKQWQRVFNRKMTYRLDSDIVVPYSVLTRASETNKNFTALSLSKTKHAAWLVSHCGTQSRREEYVKQLQKHYPVDIFGACGPGGAVKQTKFELLKDYRFYLSFENSLCVDYITEKFFDLFDSRLDIIPIVRGGADYGKMVPNGTYINTADFPRPKDLAEYLKYIEGNVTAYAAMLRQKDKYVTAGFERTLHSGFCDVCVRLHDNEYSPPSETVSWLSRNTCKTPMDLGT